MLAVALSIAALTTPAPSDGQVTAATEMLGMDAPDAFRIGSHQMDSVMELTEMVVPPEKVETWRDRMISLVLLRDGVARTGADAYHAAWMKHLADSCPGMTATTRPGTVDRRPATEDEIVCPKNPQTGLPEYLTSVTIAGQANILIAQVAFRHTVSPKDRALVAHVMRSLKVCNTPTLAACAARKATGFVAGR